MKALGKYVRECCGKRLAGKHQFCPVCGAKADRPIVDPAALAILMQIDTRARSSETHAAKLQEQVRCLDAGEEVSQRVAFGDTPSAQRRVLVNSIGGFTKSALWYRSVETLITDLLRRADAPTPR